MKTILIVIVLCAFVLTCSYADNLVDDCLVPVCSHGKWGYANNNMDVVVPIQWDYASYYRASATAIVGLKQSNGDILYGLIDNRGNCLVPCLYYIWDGESENFFGGECGYYLIVDPQSMLRGYYDIQNGYFCEPIYTDVILWYKNDKNIISVATNDIDGRIYINSMTGEQIGTYDYFDTYPWHENAALCFSMDEKQWIQYFDGSRKEVPMMFKIRSDICQGLFIVKMHEEFYLMNLNAKIVSTGYSYIEITPMGIFQGENNGVKEVVYCQLPD